MLRIYFLKKNILKKRHDTKRYISDVCLVLNIHDQLAALKVSLKRSCWLSPTRTHTQYADTQQQTEVLAYYLGIFIDYSIFRGNQVDLFSLACK